MGTLFDIVEKIIRGENVKPIKKITKKIEANIVLQAPGCKALPVYMESRDENENTIISAWELSEENRKKVLETGKIYLSIRAKYCPPVLVTTDPEDIFFKEAL